MNEDPLLLSDPFWNTERLLALVVAAVIIVVGYGLTSTFVRRESLLSVLGLACVWWSDGISYIGWVRGGGHGRSPFPWPGSITRVVGWGVLLLSLLAFMLGILSRVVAGET